MSTRNTLYSHQDGPHHLGDVINLYEDFTDQKWYLEVKSEGSDYVTVHVPDDFWTAVHTVFSCSVKAL